MARPVVFVLASVYFAGLGFGQDSSKVPLSFPGEQKTVHSGRGGQRGYGHQGITKGDRHWFLFGTDKICRYETTDFTADQATLKVKNEAPFAHADFKETGINHLGAPHHHEGRVYTFVKTPNETPFDKAVMRLIWFSADDLSYKKGSFLDLAIPPDDDGNHLVVAGGPHIVGDMFFAAMTKKVDGKPVRMHEIGRFSLKAGKYLGAVQLDYWYVRPQALVVDEERNFYVMETRGHLKKFSPSGEYLGTVFEGAVPAIYEGFSLDAETKKATVSITKGSRDHGEEGRGIFIVGIGLKNGE
ncbi:hypothetical protein ACFL5Q_01990 [Planctomycetota bacterium]